MSVRGILIAGALGFLCLLSVVFGVTFFAPAGDALYINLAGRQRMLSQKVSKEALSYLNAPTKEGADALDLTSRLFESTHAALLGGGEAPTALDGSNPAQVNGAQDAELKSLLTEPAPPPARLSAPATVCRPGRGVELKGRNLGAQPGRITLTGLGKRRTLRATGWSANQITARVPGDLTGVGDGTVRLIARTADGRRSNAVSCVFRARREGQKLRLSRYVEADCGAGGPALDRNTSSGRLAGCSHQGPSRTGTDRWRSRPLANGWTIKGWHFEDASTGGAQVEVLREPRPGDTAAAVELKWQVGEAGEAAYRFVVEIEGPVGLSPDSE